MKRSLAGIAMLVGMGMLVASAHAVVPVPTGSPLPDGVVTDDNGNLVGAVIGFSGRRPLILMRNGSERILLTIKEDFTFSIPVSVYYDGADCTGSAVGIESFTKFGGAKGFMEWQDRVYGIGMGQVLYRNSNTTSQTITAASRFVSVNSTGSQCIDFGGSSGQSDLFPLEQVDDLDTLFLAPFTLE